MTAAFEFCVTDFGELLSTQTKCAVGILWQCRTARQDAAAFVEQARVVHRSVVIILVAPRYMLTYERRAPKNSTNHTKLGGSNAVQERNQSNVPGLVSIFCCKF